MNISALLKFYNFMHLICNAWFDIRLNFCEDTDAKENVDLLDNTTSDDAELCPRRRTLTSNPNNL